MTHYIACKKTSDVVNVAQLYFQEVCRPHGLPLFIVSDREILDFFANFGDVCGGCPTQLDFGSAYHLQTDQQMEDVNCLLGDLLRCLVGEDIKLWDQ